MNSYVKRLEAKVSLPSISAAKDFVRRVSDFKCTATLTSDRYIVDAKSIMGVFSLNLSEPLNLSFEASREDNNDCEAAMAEIKEYIVE